MIFFLNFFFGSASDECSIAAFHFSLALFFKYRIVEIYILMKTRPMKLV